MKQISYDLEERTAKFGEGIIAFLSSIPLTFLSQPLTPQLIRSATSVGANYMEANHAYTKKDFCNKVSLCTKEAK